MDNIREVFLIGLFVVVLYLGALLYGAPAGDGSAQSSIRIPVMNGSGDAVIVDARVVLWHGSGRIFVDISDSLVDDFDTQPVIKDAIRAAEKASGKSLKDYDTVVSVDANGATIKGNSLGAPIAVAVVAAIRNAQVNDSVAITGAVYPDGRIGGAGKILEKARAVNESGIRTFLVPEGSAVQTRYTERKVCNEQYNDCYAVREEEEINVGREAGVDVVEVKDVNEALLYALT